MADKTPTWDSIVNEYAYLKACEKRLKEINNLPSCNDCALRLDCNIAPVLGDDARINCYLHVPQ